MVKRAEKGTGGKEKGGKRGKRSELFHRKNSCGRGRQCEALYVQPVVTQTNCFLYSDRTDYVIFRTVTNIEIEKICFVDNLRQKHISDF